MNCFEANHRCPRHFVRSLAKGSVDFLSSDTITVQRCFSYQLPEKQAGSQLFRALFFFPRALAQSFLLRHSDVLDARPFQGRFLALRLPMS